MEHRRVALVVGATGIAGRALSRRLVANGWTVYGVSRSPEVHDGVRPISVDVTDADATRLALSSVDPTHVFFTAWKRMPTEAEACVVNAAMVTNTLAALPAHGSLVHVGLVTGLKHYLGPFESYAQGGAELETPLRESLPRRVEYPNFYYAQEDALFEAAAARGCGWTVHRPHTIIGMALGNAMNMGQTLAAYAALCKHLSRPLVFPGSAAQWHGLTDMTCAAQLAAHVEWGATHAAARNTALNVVNGDAFRWKFMWRDVAAYFGVENGGLPPAPRPLVEQMAGDAPAWRALAAAHGLVEPDLLRVAVPWHTDADLGRPIEVVTDMSKSRELGFAGYVTTRTALLALFDELRARRVIPA